ncbi:hypothetical protein FN846DRAFT_771493 [Sphaerosporella brunnea]|uniref:Integrase catalytic domain-containing protein n=1 Tax=Sphaerosporella brunnea TaxID=1250544 RepID=A0A5J5FAX1_9PEZI|nr:hypothetical protein FN846DRAFT_771493 [Sphaerosporella brunnea]
MATNYRNEELTEHHPARLVSRNRFEEYVPVPRNRQEIQVLLEPLRPIVCFEPFEIIHVDYSGPYQPSAGNRYCLYIIDAFTGWLEVKACSRATGKEY